MFYRSRAPLRISLAGGGTDIADYADRFGGLILNATIDKYAHASVKPRDDDRVVLTAIDLGQRLEYEDGGDLPLDGQLDLFKGVHNRIVQEFNGGRPLGLELTAAVDAPPGSGLGSSSTLVVAMLGAYTEWLKLPLAEYDVAHLALDIERSDLGFAGGSQDQYAAVFGGWNFMEFERDHRVLVNPLRIRSAHLRELEFNLLLYYTGTSRLSSDIIEHQIASMTGGERSSLDSMHGLKEQALLMKEALLRGQFSRMGEILDYGWNMKKATAGKISNPMIDELYETAKAAGAAGGKISGAGGGGFMMLYCPGNTRYAVSDALQPFGGYFHDMKFSEVGVTTWHVQ